MYPRVRLFHYLEGPLTPVNGAGMSQHNSRIFSRIKKFLAPVPTVHFYAGCSPLSRLYVKRVTYNGRAFSAEGEIINSYLPEGTEGLKSRLDFVKGRKSERPFAWASDSSRTRKVLAEMGCGWPLFSHWRESDMFAAASITSCYRGSTPKKKSPPVRALCGEDSVNLVRNLCLPQLGKSFRQACWTFERRKELPPRWQKGGILMWSLSMQWGV